MKMAGTVLDWLDSIQLLEYGELFKETGYTDLKDLSVLNEELLVTMGITKRGHRNRILQRLPKVDHVEQPTPKPEVPELPQPIPVHLPPSKAMVRVFPPELPAKTKSVDDQLSRGTGNEALPDDMPSLPPPMPPRHSNKTAVKPDFDDEKEYFDSFAQPGTQRVTQATKPPPPRRELTPAEFDDPEYIDTGQNSHKTVGTENTQTTPERDSNGKPPIVSKPVIPPRPEGGKGPKPKKPPRRNLNQVRADSDGSSVRTDGDNQANSSISQFSKSDRDSSVIPRPALPIPKQDDSPSLPPPIPVHRESPPSSGFDRPPPPIPKDEPASGIQMPESLPVTADNSTSRPSIPVPSSTHDTRDTTRLSQSESFSSSSHRNSNFLADLNKRLSIHAPVSSKDTEERTKKEALIPPVPALRKSLGGADVTVDTLPTKAPPLPPARASQTPSPPDEGFKEMPQESEDKDHALSDTDEITQESDDESLGFGDYVDMTQGSAFSSGNADAPSVRNSLSERPPMHLPLEDRGSVRRSMPGFENIPQVSVVPPLPQVITEPVKESDKPPPLPPLRRSERDIDTQGSRPYSIGAEPMLNNPVQSRQLPSLPPDISETTTSTGNTNEYSDLESATAIANRPDKDIGNEETAYDYLVSKPRERSAPVDPRKRSSNIIDFSPTMDSPTGAMKPSVILPPLPDSKRAYHRSTLLDSDRITDVLRQGHSSKPPPEFPPPPPPSEPPSDLFRPVRAKQALSTFGSNRPVSANILDVDLPPPPPPPIPQRTDSQIPAEYSEPNVPLPQKAAPQVPPLPVRGKVDPRLKAVQTPTAPEIKPPVPALPMYMTENKDRNSTISTLSFTSLEPLKDETDDGDNLRGYDSDASDVSDETLSNYVLRGPELDSKMKEMKRLSQSAYTPGQTPGSLPDLSISHDTQDKANSSTCMVNHHQKERTTEKSGYLFKQGGKQRNRGWRKRWVVFDGKDLRYYGNKDDKVSKRVIPVGSMRNVEISVKSGDKPYRFFVFTRNRKFEFAADNNDEMSVWSSKLMEAIITYKEPEGGFPDGGDMFNPDKEGHVKMNGEKRYIAVKGAKLCYYVTIEDFKAASPISEIEMKIATVKDMQRNKLTLITPHLQQPQILIFENNEEMRSWAEALTEAVQEGLSDPTALLFVRQNPSNKYCADCGAENPDWVSINLCVVICKQCAGNHRGLGVEISKVRSLRMDKLSQTMQQILLKIGNENVNAVWEGRMPSAEFKIKPAAPKEHRRVFIEKKYRQKQLFKEHPTLKEGRTALNEALIAAATSDDCLVDIAHMVFSGADPTSNDTGVSAIDVARANNQHLIMEFLNQNTGGGTPQSVNSDSPLMDKREPTPLSPPTTAVPPLGRAGQGSPSQDSHDLKYTGFLHKTGGSRKDFQKRWCVFENGALTYFVDDKATAAKNSIEARDILSVSCDNPDFALKLGHTHCFEIGTTSGRTYLFSADYQMHQRQWIKTITKSVAPSVVWDLLENFNRAGCLYMREGTAGGWQKNWFILRGRGFMFFSPIINDVDTLDLRKLVNLISQPEDRGSLPSEGCNVVIGIVMPKRTVYILADTKQESDEWLQALKTASTSTGKNLHEQQLTEDNVPVLVSKCIGYIAIHGLTEEGIYRRAGQDSKVKSVLAEFSADARSVNLDDYPVHEVANALKRFFRNLPDPLLTKALHAKWIEIAGYDDHNSKLQWYKYCLEQLPQINRETLKKLIGHLLRISEHSKENKMVIANLAAVWGPTLMSSGSSDATGFDSTNVEISIIGDILTYYNWLFDVTEEDAEHQRMIERKLSEGYKKLTALTEQQKQSSGFLIGVTFAGTELNIKVSPDTTADQYVQSVITKHKLDQSRNYALFEVLCNGLLERPIHGSENVLHVSSTWSHDNKGSENTLCVKENYLLAKWQEGGDLQPYGTVKINSEKKNFKKLHLELQGKTLRCYKDGKATGKPEGEWSVDHLKIYIGADTKKTLPSKYAFTCKSDDNKTRIVCVDSEYELGHWVGALLRAKYPNGFSSVIPEESVHGSLGAIAQYQPQPNAANPPFRESLGKKRFEAFAAELSNKARKYSIRKKKH
ncbi:arf-GAP with Rho-GAP domain, ANK repeat and PH domain-containing protein 1-like isoform X2 [Ptychodera flava]|uniref:arf-GAP with Rho-GAP domain, ANK repeat and PH domain-containing protein 1-like isoform X2 n=1 Tax=Ptychodera flava TaxID=63121 RepID=UPI00396A442F